MIGRYVLKHSLSMMLRPFLVTTLFFNALDFEPRIWVIIKKGFFDYPNYFELELPLFEQ